MEMHNILFGKVRKTYIGSSYVASNGKMYDRKETPYEYEQRKKENEEKHKAYLQRETERSIRQREREERELERKNRRYRLERAKNNLIRAKNGYPDDIGYVTKDGRVYDHKETREEYEERQIRKLEKEANRIRNKNK